MEAKIDKKVIPATSQPANKRRLSQSKYIRHNSTIWWQIYYFSKSNIKYGNTNYLKIPNEKRCDCVWAGRGGRANEWVNVCKEMANGIWKSRVKSRHNIIIHKTNNKCDRHTKHSWKKAGSDGGSSSSYPEQPINNSRSAKMEHIVK